MKPTFYSEISEGANLLHQLILEARRNNSEIKTLEKGCQPVFQYWLCLCLSFIAISGGFQTNTNNL